MNNLIPHLSASALILSLATMPATGDAARVEANDHLISIETIADGLEHPWGLALMPDGRYLVTERNPGQLRIGTADGDLSEPVEGVPEIFRYEGETGRSQAGLFDVKLHPDFADNNMLYLSYSKPTERGAAVAITRARLVEETGERPRLADQETIFEMKEEDQDSSGLHFGGRLAIHPEDQSLLLSIGERRNISRSQDKDDQAGSILRLNADGSAHDDNPFHGDDEGDDSIYATGIRNAQGLGFNPENGQLWATEHGPLGGDEINLIEAGNNYGWPYITAGVDYSGAPIGLGADAERDEFTTPAHTFEGTVAPSGLTFYDGDMFDAWRGDMLVGGLANESLIRLDIENGRITGEEMIGLDRRIRDVAVGEDGSIWLITEYQNGEVLRLTTNRD